MVSLQTMCPSETHRIETTGEAFKLGTEEGLRYFSLGVGKDSREHSEVTPEGSMLS